MKTEAKSVFVRQFLSGSFLETRASSAAWVATWWSWGGPSCCCSLFTLVLLVDITQAEGPGLCYFIIIFRAVLYG